jgi:hypothetical protein
MIERGVHRNAIVVALANKLARIAWAALRKEATSNAATQSRHNRIGCALLRVGQRCLQEGS